MRLVAVGLCFIIALSAGLACAAAAPKGKHAATARHHQATHDRIDTRVTVHRKRRPGYLPGFEPGGVYSKKSLARLRRYHSSAYTLPPFYTWEGDRYYPGRPRFSGGRWNGGSFGPCWAQTPIGPMWTCGN